jgi:Domain of unknown function (DUF4082)/Bacterial Ig domain/Secretion system C-terminal sorting domain
MPAFYSKADNSNVSATGILNQIGDTLFFASSISERKKTFSDIGRKFRRLLFFISFLLITTAALAQNAIVTENALAGNPISEWGVPSFRDASINGFSTEIGVNKGQTVRFKINVSGGVAYTIKIYRIGYYGGNGARLITNLGSFTGIVQPAGLSNAVTGLLDCGNWTESSHWDVPLTAVSGLYIAKLERNGGGSNHIAFIVRDDAGSSDLYFQIPDATWQAYNGYGGNYLYNGTTSLPSGHASKVSYNRPIFPYNTGFATDGRQSDWYMNAEYPMIRWLERNGYNISYTTSIDVVRHGDLIKNHKVFVTNGHDEYWSKEQRDNVETARSLGVHMAFFAGNEVYWKTRWEADASGNDHRTLVCYKEGTLGDGSTGESSCGTKCDVSSPVWTGLWRMGAAYDAGLPENSLTGQISWAQVSGAIQVPDTYKNLRFWRNTTIANLGSGQVATLAPNTLDHEWDYEQYAASYPNVRIALSSTTINGLTHKLSLYRHSSGALVFGAGTVQWSWGLDGAHFGGTTTISKDMQQATLNLFADMGVQPGSKQADLVAATASTDVTAPVSTITAPANGASVVVNAAVNITGTATDANAIAGVEVSVDGGLTWQLATGTANWTYSWVPTAAGTVTIKSRGFDDSGNLQAAGSGPAGNVITITVTNTGSFTCPCSIFLPSNVPSSGLSNDGQAIELGVKFRSNTAGYIKGIRFYKTSGNTGTHTGELYSLTGTRLAQAVFGGETATGWQQVLFSAPVAIAANTTYLAAYHSSAGNYTGTANYFTSAVIINPLTGLANGTDGANGVYVYSATPAFPTNSPGNAPNYWVDVVYDTSNGPTANAGSNQTITLPTSQVTLNGSASTGATSYAWTRVSGPNTPIITSPAAVTTTVTGLVAGTYVFQLSINGGISTSNVTITVNPAPAPTANAGSNQTIALPTTTVTLDGSASTGATSYAWTRVSGPNTPIITSPAAVTTTVTGLVAGTYVFQLSINGGVSTSQVTVIVNAVGSNIFTTQIPVAATGNDGQAIELGVKFRSSVAGYITGIRFYKTSGNTGTHTGELYSSTGTRLAQTVFSGETATGWQQVLFSTPVAITANTTYVASYHSSAGNYVGTANYFTAAVVNSPLTGLASGTDGANGVYNYSTTPVFPNSSPGNAPNYWVDVVFSTSAVPTANAGSNQNITLPTSSVTLDGSASTGATNYVWTRVSGPNTPTITSPAAVTTTVTGLVAGTYVFQLSINSGASTSQVTVTVNPAPPPTANAGSNQAITLPTSSVTLNGSASTGATSYVWTRVSGPNTPTIASPTSVSTTVTGLIQGVYVFQLSINSGASTSQVTVTVNPAPPPAANAGSNQTIMLPASSVTLDGSGSTGSISSYAWTRVSGPNTPTIASPTSVSTLVTGLIQGTYIFQLSLNAGVSISQVTVNVVPAASSIFTTQTPASATSNDGQALELGVKFRSNSAGYITGIRFYKTSGNTGTHTGELYSSTGTRLAQAVFTGETATGWQQVLFSTPVAVTANTTYVAAYHSSAGNYTGTPNYFTTAVVNNPLTGLANGTDGANGVYNYSATPIFPNSSPGNAPNYWVDAVFSTSNQPQAAQLLTDTLVRAQIDAKNPAVAVGKASYSLGQNYPNPVYLDTRFSYSVPVTAKVDIALYDMQGRKIRILVSEVKEAGVYSYKLNGNNFTKGIYLYRMRAGNYSEVKKLVIQ